MKAATIFKGIGILFVLIGISVGLLLMVGPLSEVGEPAIMMGPFFLIIFGGIGGLFTYLGFHMDSRERKILKDGAVYLGKIMDHRADRRVMINGAPALALAVRYFRNGEICEAVVNTGDADRAAYPIGSTVSISILNGSAALVPGSVSQMHIEREEDLLNPDFDPNTNVSSIGVKCPNCGANIMVPYGMSRICPYCDSKITVSADGKIVNS